MDDLTGVSMVSLLEHAHVGVVIHRWDTSILFANPVALNLLQLTREQLSGRDIFDPRWHMIDDGDRRLPVEEYPVNRVKRSGEPIKNEIFGVVSDIDSVSWFNVNAYIDDQPNSDDKFVVVTFSDITSHRNNFSFADIVENAEDIVIVTDADFIDEPLGPKIVYVNQAFEKLTGYCAHEVIGETPRILQGPDTDKAVTKRIHEALVARRPIREKLLNYSKTGHRYWLEMNIMPLTNRYGVVTHFAAIERDVTVQIHHDEQLQQRNCDLKALKQNLQDMVSKRTNELRAANHRLERLAYSDPLTGIPNRRSFMAQAAKLLALAQRHDWFVLTGIVDVDHFKDVNDKFGHDAGDRVLVSLAESMAGFFRGEDVLGRIGGEEFAFCMVMECDSGAEAICERLRQTIGQHKILLHSSTAIELTVSIGASMSKVSSPTSLNSELGIADVALYRAKNAGRDTVDISRREL